MERHTSVWLSDDRELWTDRWGAEAQCVN